MEDRLCKICEEGFVEDEIHFVSVCSKYRKKGENFYLKISNKYLNFKILNIFDKFMKNANHHFANFINVIWSKRSSPLYK